MLGEKDIKWYQVTNEVKKNIGSSRNGKLMCRISVDSAAAWCIPELQAGVAMVTYAGLKVCKQANGIPRPILDFN